MAMRATLNTFKLFMVPSFGHLVPFPEIGSAPTAEAFEHSRLALDQTFVKSLAKLTVNLIVALYVDLSIKSRYSRRIGNIEQGT